ncbi:MAG: uracil phosphoribosyltransferase [Chloroflexi bacterium]|nr:uracil phosphoribosyltransferase [Chloroflexota bacterium]MXX65942.1 uracil phosphoribosyltransferase [Chloroflexota bacterium]MYC48280.1 uracil phosphoribosyltransferase [Chloroflexota bacterium]
MPANLYVSDHPVVSDKLCELRAVATPPRRFRGVVRDLTRLLFYEASADLATRPTKTKAPLGTARGRRLQGPIALAPVMRAGLGMAETLAQMLPDTVVWHLGIRRDEQSLNPIQYYDAEPGVAQVQTCLLLDPMLATGGTAAAACGLLKRRGLADIRYVGLIAAPEGVARLHEEHPDVPIFVAALDDGLDERGFILPGLGDAGDRQYGTE